MAAENEHVAGKCRQKLQDDQLLDTFWLLAEPRDEKRISGALRLVAIVVKKQNEHERKSKKDEVYCAELSYTLTRLIKGLASSRKGARHGYAMALAELLHSIDAIKMEDVFEQMKSHLEMKGKKQEEKACIFGKIFAYIAISQSGRMLKAPEESLERIVTDLYKFSNMKGYLRDVCIQAIVDIIKQVDSNIFKQYIWPVLKADLKEGWENCTPQRLLFVNLCHNTFPDVVKSKFLKTHWGGTDLIHQDNYTNIATIIAESTIHSHPNINSVCDQVLSVVVKDSSKLAQFWTQIVDNTLCTSTHERRYLSFKLLEKTLPVVKKEDVEVLFSENLLRCIMNNLAYKTTMLHEAAKLLVENLAVQMKEISDGEKQLAVLTSILKNGGIHFDSVTKSKTVMNLVSGLNLQGVQLYSSWLKSTFLNGTPQSGKGRSLNIDGDRKWVANQLLYMIRNASLPRHEDWLSGCIRFMFLHAHFTITKPDKKIPECQTVPEEAVSESVQKQLSLYFFGALNALTNISAPQGKSTGSRLMGMTSKGEFYVYDIVMYIQQLLTSKHVQIVNDLTEDVMDSWNRMLSSVVKIRQKVSKDKSFLEGYAFQLLYLHIGLQLFTEAKQAMDILEDLHSCQDKALKKRKSLGKTDEGEPEWIEVVTEILLSLLAQSSRLLRVVVDSVFKIICPHLTKEALQLLLDVLDPNKSKEAESNVRIRRDSESDEDDDDDEDMEDDEEGEEENGDGLVNGNHDNDEDEDEEEESEDGGEGDEGDLVDEEFRRKMMAALGVTPEEEAGSSSDDDLSDSEMFKMDDMLSNMLRDRAFAKKRRGEAKTMMVHFKLRVLDMLDIFIKRQPSNPLVLELLHPLLLTIQSAVHNKGETVLAEKASTLYRNKLCRSRKYPHDIQDQSQHLHEMLENLFKVAHTAASVHMVSLASSGCLFLIRVLKGNAAGPGTQAPGTFTKIKQKEKKSDAQKDPTVQQQGLLDVEKSSQLYRSALQDFLSRRESHLHPVLFTDLIERLPDIGWCLSDLLVKSVKDGVQLYRKIQACKMLVTLMTRSNQRPIQHSWEDFFTSICAVCKDVLQDVHDSESTTKPKYLLELIRMMQALVRMTISMQKQKSGVWDVFVPLLMKIEKKEVVTRSSEITAAVVTLRNMMTNKSSSEANRKNKKRKRKKQRNRAKSAGEGSDLAS
ncbi:myb-binding protein 1A-like protein [Glandiceps talaboti]